MTLRHLFRTRALLLLVLLTHHVRGQMPESAVKYHEMLLKRPQAGLVWDRFYAAWMETGTVESLKAFLSKSTATAADHLLLAVFHQQQGNETDALKACAEAVKLQPEFAAAWMRRAKLEARLLDFEAALASLAQARQHSADDVELQREADIWRGRWLMRTGKTEEALKTWRTLLAEHADEDDLAEEVIDLLAGENLLAEAEAQMSALITRTRDPHARALRRLRLADIQSRAGKSADAQRSLRATLEESGQGTWIEAEVLAQLEQSYRRSENLSDLERQLAEWSQAQPQRIALARMRARVLAEQGVQEPALKIYRELLQRAPGQRDLQEGFVDLLERFELYPEAITQMQVIMQQHPQDRELLIRLAALHERAKDMPKALATLEQFLALSGTAEQDHLRVARLLENMQEKEAAVAAYERLVKTFPDSFAAQEAQAHFLHRNERKEAALAIWRELARKGDQSQLMAVAQALITRLEPAVAMEVLRARLDEFQRDERYLGLLVNAALNAHKGGEAVAWALARVRATTELRHIDDALRQALQTMKDDAALFDATLAQLQKPAASPQELLLLATMLEQRQDQLGAENALRSLPAEHAAIAQAHLMTLLETRQDWPRAAQEAEKLFATPQGKNSEMAARLIDLLDRSGKPSEALKHIPTWKTISPASTYPWLREARLLAVLEQPKEAMQVLQTAARKFPDEEPVIEALAAAYQNASQPKQAEQLYLQQYEKAQDLDDKLRWAGTLARSAQERGDIEPLIAQFQERQRGNRADAAPWLVLAEIYRIAERTTDEEQALREALHLRPDDVELALRLSRMDLDMGRWKQAIDRLERMESRVKGTRLRETIASIHIEHGDVETGYRMLYELVGGDAMLPDNALTLAHSLSARQNWPRLISFLEPIWQKNPDDYRLRYLLAVSLEEEGHQEQAIPHFLAVLGQKTDTIHNAKVKLDTSGAPLSATTVKRTTAPAMPPGYTELLSEFSLTFSNNAYAHRANSLSSLARSSKVGKAVSEPSSLSNARSMSLTHLLTLLPRQDDAKRAAWTEQAKRDAGIIGRYLDVLTVDERASRVSLTSAALDQHPDDDALLAYVVARSKPALDGLKRAYERFKDTFPTVALSAAMQAVHQDVQEGLPLLTAALERVEKLPEPSSDTLMMQKLLGGGFRRNELPPVALPSDLQQRLLNQLMRYYEQPSATGNTSASRLQTFPQGANACVAQGAWPEFLRLAEREVQLWQEHPPTRAAILREIGIFTRFASSRQGPPALIAPLPFPTGSLLPPNFVRFLTMADYISLSGPTETFRSDPDTFGSLLPRLDSVKNPALRAILAAKAGADDRVEKEIDALLAAGEPGVDELLFAASWFSHQRKTDRERELLLRLIKMPVPSAHRMALDAALVHAADRSTTGKDSPELAQAAQMALRRLRVQRVSTEQKDELLSAMKKLGMGTEADDWARITRAIPTPPRRNNYVSSSSTMPDMTQLKKLASGTDKAATAREAVLQLRHCLNTLSSPSSSTRKLAPARAKDVLSYCTDADVRARIMAAFDPGESTSATKLFEWGQLLTLIGEPQRAAQVMEKIVAVSPHNHEAALRLVLNLARSDPDRAVQLLKGIPLSAFRTQDLDQRLLALLVDERDASVETRMRIIRTLADSLAAAPPDSKTAASVQWMVNLPTLVASAGDLMFRLAMQGLNVSSLPSSISISSLPSASSLYQRSPSLQAISQIFRPDQAPALRRETHDHLCLAMMKHPTLAEEGFRRYAGLQIAHAGDLAKLDTQALEVLQTARQHQNTANVFGSATPVTGGSSKDEIWCPAPQEYLLWRAWKTQKPDLVEKEVFPLARAVLDVRRMEFLERMWAVWTCPPENFANAVQTMLRGQSSTAYQMWLIDCWRQRDIPGTPLDDMFAQNLNPTSALTLATTRAAYLEQRQAMRPEVPVEPFLEKMLVNVFGERRETWYRQVKMLVTDASGNSSSTSPAYPIVRMLELLLRDEKTHSIGQKLAEMTHVDTKSTFVLRNQPRAKRVNAPPTPVSIFDDLQRHGWLEDFAKLPFVNGTTPAKAVIERLHEHNNDQLRQLIASHRPQTSGTAFCSALAAADPAAAMTDFLKQHAIELQKLPKDGIPAFIAILKFCIPSLHKLETAPPELQRLLQPLLPAGK